MSRPLMRLTPALLALLLLGPRAGESRETAVRESPAFGVDVGRLSFIDSRWLPRSLDEFGEKSAFVLVFVTNGCPIADRYLPRLAAMEREYRPRGAQFVAVNVGAADSVVEMAAAGVDHGLEFPVVKDLDGGLARAVGASVTPQVAVLDGGRRLRYRGRIDAQYRLGGTRPTPGREDLREALEDVLAGRDVRVPETETDGCGITFPSATPPEIPPTFAERVMPLLQKHCQECHRPGGDAPFSLTTYEDARKRSTAIVEALDLGRMPPSFADPRHGTFVNERRLPEEVRRTILDWARGGTPLGDPQAMPPMIEWPAGRLKISKPDLVLKVPIEVEVPAEGYLPYQYQTLHKDTMLPFLFMEDTWVQEIQILPRNPSVLHHANLFFFDGPSQARNSTHFITGQVPGGDPMRLSNGTAFLIPKGSALALQMHYVPNGKPEKDRISVGLVFAKETVRRRLYHLEITNHRFAIPPGAPAHEVREQETLPNEAVGLGMYAHMHLRGRDMRFVAHLPDGSAETLLLVPNYSFDWQTSYVWAPGAKRFPAGTAIECIAHYDNSRFNPFNPDPAKTVKHGQETIDEMMYGFFFYVNAGEDLNLAVDPATGRAPAASK